MTAAQLRVGRGVPAGGQFTGRDRDEPEVDLTGDQFRAHLAQTLGDTFADEALKQIADLPEPVRQLYMACAVAGTHLDPEEAAVLADLGYRTSEDIDQAAGLLRVSTDFLSVHEVSPRRAELIAETGISIRHRTGGPVNKALLTADIAQLEELTKRWPDLDGDEAKYIAVIGMVDPALAEKAAQSFAAGCRRPAWIESPYDIDLLKAIDVVDPKHDAVAYAANGHTAASLTEYGSSLCRRFPAAELAAAGVPGKVMRSLAQPLQYDLQRIAHLHRHGVTSGQVVRRYTSTLAAPTPANIAYASRLLDQTGINPQEFVDKMTRGYRLTTADVDALVTFADAGYTDPDRVRQYVTNLTPEASAHAEGIGRDTPVLPLIASIIRTGVTEERAAHLTRCGIPPHRIGEFKDSADPWADGAPFRARYEAEEERQAATWAAMRGPAKKWPYTSPPTF